MFQDGRGRACAAFCNGCLVERLPQDQPFHENEYWLPDYVYLKYIKVPLFYREYLKYHKERHLTTDTDD
jgi:hypothetical protein